MSVVNRAKVERILGCGTCNLLNGTDISDEPTAYVFRIEE